MRRLFALPLILALAGCPPRIDTGNDGGGVIFATPEGGIFIREGAVIDIPKGALEKDAQITVTVVDTGIPEIPMRKRVSYGFRFSPSTLTFKQPVKIGVTYLEDRVPKGVDVATFDERRNTPEDPYLALPSPETVTQFKLVTAKTERLGLFWATSPESPAVSTLKIEPPEVFLMVGGTQQFSATITDPTGKEVKDAPVAWSIVPPRVAKVDATGLVTALAPGTATLTARAGQVTQTAKVYVPGTTPGPQTFVHDNPFPTGNDLWGGTIALGQAFFVGGNATVLGRSGNQWSRLFSSPMVTLKAIGGSPANAVAVGVTGNTGVLVEMKTGATAPSVKLFPTVEPRALWFDGTHGMAVGYGNDVIVRRNGEWVKEYSPSVETLLSVVGDGAGGFTTLGSLGSLYRFDPASMTWNSLFQSQLSVLLTAAVVQDVAGTEAWAVGGGKLWKFTGAWAPINLPPQPAVSELTAVAKVDGKLLIAGNAQKQGFLFTYDPAVASADAGTPAADGGTSLPAGWTAVALRTPQIIRGIFGAGTEAYAVGDLGAIWHSSGGTGFIELSRGFYGNVTDVGVASEDGGTEVVAAAVNECTTPACTVRVGKVMIRNGPGSWSELGSGQPFNGPLSSIIVKSATEIYVGGEGYVSRYNGTAWANLPLTGGPQSKISDLAMCGSTLWAVGPSGANFKGNSTSLGNQPQLGPNDLHAVQCPAETQIWIAGDSRLYEGKTARNTNGVNHGFWRTVWSPGQGEAFAFGDARYGVYWDTQQLNVIDSPAGILPEVVNSLWGSSIDNLYAVGYSTLPLTFGFALRFDGATWRMVDPGAHRKGTVVTGASNLQVWLGTEGGGVLRGVPPQ